VDVLNQLVMTLLAWTLLSLGAGLLGLNATSHPRWRAFWFMTGLWGWIDGAIVLYALVAEPLPLETLRSVLWFNAGLDVCYIVTGAALISRPSDRWRGFGGAIIIQGLFLLALDVTMASRIG
jgi:hypothetical protein